jgi:cell division protein FtsI (penicillin-binding protein 3)
MMRNRSVTDVFEPGSTMKPLTVAAALETNRFTPETEVFTAPERIKLNGHAISDMRDLGRLDVAGVVRMSSNVGASRIALSLDKRHMWRTFADFGVGAPTGSRFPGEASGQLAPPGGWGGLEQATMAFGYGVSVTPLQLVRAYAAFANGGILPPVRLRSTDDTERQVQGQRVISQASARQVRSMLDEAVSPDGTGNRAQIAGYRVAGKTGTAHKVGESGYAEDRYRAVFAGFAPVDDARLAAVVMLDEPGGGAYYGGQVAAPVFAQAVAGGLRMLGVAPSVQTDTIMASGPEQQR